MTWSLFRRSSAMPTADDALPGRSAPMPITTRHDINGTRLTPPWPVGSQTAIFGLGCFWGAEKAFWSLPGVVTTAVGYAGGFTPNPTYEEVCTGRTGHAEVVLIVFDPARISYEDLLRAFWEHHDPTQGMRQGNDVGTQYRSIILTTDDTQPATAAASRDAYQRALTRAGFGAITTTIEPAGPFYYAESYHQQYLSKVLSGSIYSDSVRKSPGSMGYYCPNHSTGVKLPDDFVVTPLTYVD